jgi:hypothetical protein
MKVAESEQIVLATSANQGIIIRHYSFSVLIILINFHYFLNFIIIFIIFS